MYDEAGEELLGEYGQMFEEEYRDVVNNYITIFDTPYQRYLKAIEVEDTHKGYFSIDKKGHAVNSAIKRGSDFSDDISAYDLILKNKERLLSFSEPTRFIFSHSALREGWDNPNVFQICTLKHSDSTTMKRQEVGRGLRLCVNQDGFRMDEQSLGKELVHKVNKLTVVASESYKDFVTDLQRQIKDVLYDRPTKASKEYFVGKMIHVDGVPQKISDQQATAIYRYLLKNDYIDDNEHITEQYRADLENNALAPLAEELKTMTEGIHKLIQSIFNDKILEDMIGNGNETTVPSNDLNENFAKKEFQTLADIIDFDPKRTPSVLFSHLAVKNPVSLNEWKKHQSINAWTISPKRILFSAQCEHPAIEATILAFCNQIDEELRNGTVILSNLSDDGMGINMETYKIPLPPQVDRRKIQAKKDIISGKPIYRYHDTKFSLSKKQIIDLLMGTKLYGKPEVALRELLQNSIDACLLRQKLSELWGIEYTPKVKVSLYTKNNVDYLQVSDNGVGMNQHIIDNYYTNIGCSYYSSREFSDLMVSFKSSFTPISRFGIGILSCFMVCDSMEVTTRRIRERFECDEALHVSIEGYESLFVISDSDKKDPGTDTILTLRPVHPWDRMDEDEFVQCIKGIVPNPAVQIEIETDKRSESYSSDYFDDLDLSPLLDYSWNNTKNIRKIDIDLTCEEYGFKGRGCIGILIKNDMPVEEIEILSKDVEIDGEIYTLSSSVKYKNNCITETSTSISVDEDGEIDTNTSWSERFKSKSSLSIHGIEVPYNLFPNYSNKMSKAVLNILFPFSFRLDIGVNSDLNLNSARDQIIYDEKWLTFEENLYQVICKRLKEQLSLSDWERLNEIIQKNGKNIFSRVANNIE